MKAVYYMRVSRDDLHCENQRAAGEAWFARNKEAGDTIVFVTEEESSRKARPIKERIVGDFRNGVYDTIATQRIDRYARSLMELFGEIEGIINDGGRFVSVGNGFDLQKKGYNASQQLQLAIFAAFAQFEREIIRERTFDGLARAKAQGKIGGRHPVRCGCGRIAADGSRHDGDVKALRDPKNKIIGWRWPDGTQTLSKQTLPVEPPAKAEGDASNKQTGV